MSQALGVSVIIPTFNGEALLRRCLPALRAALMGVGRPHEVIIVDDGGSDDTEGLVNKEYPEFRYIRLAQNAGFGEACNKGVESAGHEVVYLLNNDVVVPRGFLEPLMRHFDSPDIFAAGSIEEESGGYYQRPRLKFRFGQFWYYYIREKVGDAPVESFFVSAGHAAFHRARFLGLGGFDPLYRPFYWEDADICYRAWKRGWASVYDPESVVEHRHGSTIGLKKRSYVMRTHWRNRFLFTWKNLGSPMLWVWHLLFLAPLVIASPLAGRRELAAGFLSALGRIGEIKRERGRTSDERLLARFR